VPCPDSNARHSVRRCRRRAAPGWVLAIKDPPVWNSEQHGERAPTTARYRQGTTSRDDANSRKTSWPWVMIATLGWRWARSTMMVESSSMWTISALRGCLRRYRRLEGSPPGTSSSAGRNVAELTPSARNSARSCRGSLTFGVGMPKRMQLGQRRRVFSGRNTATIRKRELNFQRVCGV